MMPHYPEAHRRQPAMFFLGLPMHQVGAEQVLFFFDEVIRRGEKAIALNLNVHCVTLALKHAWLHQFINQAHLVYCDGDGVRLGLKWLGFKPPPKVTYNVWMWKIAEYCEREGRSLYLLGAKPGIAEEAKSRLLEKHPKLCIAGVQHGYFDKHGAENEKVIEKINAVSPDILLVCFGMPEQELWIRENWKKIKAHIFIKGGAALDYASGRLQKAPDWMIRMHLEWLFRLGQEPVRLFGRYVIGNTWFLLEILMEKFGIKKWRAS